MMATYAAFAVLMLLLGRSSEAMGPFPLTDILTATGGRATGCDGEITFDGISTDSRTVQQGELFWALSGHNHDGHAWISDARKRGAAGAVSHRADNVGPTICVPDTQAALQQFAAWHRAKQDALVIGVTGSFGKTTTREMIHAVLSQTHHGIRSPHNYNNHIGVPLTLLDLSEPHEFAVVELGASAVGEIDQLAQLAVPEIGVITGIGPAHLEGFGTVERIIEAKSELLSRLPETGFAVLAGDDDRVRAMASAANCPTIFVGERDHNDIQATGIQATTEQITFDVNGDSFRIHAIGTHHVQAALIAIAIGREIGMSTAEIRQGLAAFLPVAGRCQPKTIGEWHIIDDTYNANPASMKAACRLLNSCTTHGQRVLIAGDMMELGSESTPLHKDLGECIARLNIDKLITYGAHSSIVASAAINNGLRPDQIAVCNIHDTIHTVLDCWLEPDDVVLIKGSRSLKMERIVEWLEQKTNKDNRENINRTVVRACA